MQLKVKVLSVLAALCLALVTEASQIQDRHHWKPQFTRVPPGTAVNFTSADYPRFTKRDISAVFYSDRNATLSVSCLLNLPCSRHACCNIRNFRGATLGTYCSPQGTVLQTPLLNGTYFLKMYMSAGRYHGSNFTCQLTSRIQSDN